MRWLAGVWAVVMVALGLLWLSRPEPLTLQQSTHWSPPAVLDTSQVESPPPLDVSECVAVDAMTLPELAIADLLAVGWSSDPLDGGEWIYSPGCG